MTTEPQTAAPAARATVGRILQAVGVCLVVFHAAQTFFGDLPLAAVIAFAGVAAGMVGFRLEVLRSVRTVVVLLVLLSVACILGTLTVQRSQLSHDTEDQFRDTATFAWAHLAYKISHPFPGESALDPMQEQRLERLALAFGDEVADEERETETKRASGAAGEAAARELAEAHPSLLLGIFRIADAARLTDLFVAWWFIGLFYLLSANLLFGAVVRRRVSLRNVGFHAAHLGLVLIVLGATVGAFTGKRGVLPMSVGQASATFSGESPAGPQPLGFSVRLDDFETHYHEDLVIEALAYSDPHQGGGAHGAMGHGSTRPLRHTVKLEEGATLGLTDPETGETYELTLAEIAEAAALRQVRGPAGAGEHGVSALALDTGGAAQDFGLTDPVWMSADDPLYIDPTNRYKVRLEPWEGGETPPSLGLECEVGVGTLTLIEDGGQPLQTRLVEGSAFTLGRFTGTAEQVVPDFRVGEIPPGPEGFPRNPALRVWLADETGEGGSYLMFSDPRLKGFTTLPWDGVQASFEYDYWCAPTGAWIRVMLSAGGDAAAAVILPSDPVDLSAGEPDIPPAPVGASVEIVDGSELAMPGLDAPLVVVQMLGSAVESEELVSAEEAAASGLPALARTALRLRIDGPAGTEERWLLSNTEQGATWLGREADDSGAAGSAGFGLLLANNTDRPPRDWRSHVSFLEEGIEVGSGVMEVNTPATHAGYAFFQSDASARDPDYSGLSVVNDPAWPLVEAGLWALLLGICWCFYVQPLFDRRARARRANGA